MLLKTNLRSATSTGAILLFVFNTAAMAQQQGLEEIFVTARKVEESIQTTPIAVTAFTADELQARGAVNIRDIGPATPNLIGTRGPTGAGSDANFFIRGIGQEDSNAARDPGVGVYLDGIYIGRTQGAALDNLDIERIEVLRGPQGTLFGRNTIGGAVNIVTAQPAGEFGGKLRAVGGERDRVDLQGTVDLPMIGESLAVRTSLSYRRQDGWGFRPLDNVTLGNTEVFSGRIQTSYEATDDLQVAFTADFMHFDGTSNPRYAAGFVNFTEANNPNSPFFDPTQPVSAGTTPFGLINPIEAEAEVSEDWTLISTTSNDPNISSTVFGFGLTLTWNLDWAEFKSFTSYRDLRSTDRTDFDGTSFRLDDFKSSRTEQWQFSQELQLAGQSFSERLNWVTGLYYFIERTDQLTTFDFGSRGTPISPPTPFDPMTVESDQFIFPETDNVAAYAQGSFDVLDKLSLTLGARLTYEEKAMNYFIAIRDPFGVLADSLIPDFQGLAGIPVLETPIAPRSENWTSFDWRAGLEYQALDTLLFYGSVATGFRSGGFNGRATRPQEATAFDPEETISFELGFKSDMFDNRLRLNAAAFLTSYDEIQIFAPPQPGALFFSIQNAGEAEITGFEVEVQAAPVNALLLTAGLGYMDAEFTELSASAFGAGLTLQSALPATPDWTINLTAQYTADLDDFGTLTFRTDWNYQDDIVFFAGTSLSSTIQGAYDVTNARITWTHKNERISVSAYGLNVFNERYLLQAADNIAAFGVATAEPAPLSEFGAEVIFNF